MRRAIFVCIFLLTPLFGQTTYIYHPFAGGDFPAGSIATQVSMGSVFGIAVDPSGNLYVADGIANEIYKVTPAGRVNVFAKTTPATPFAFFSVVGIVADYQGNLYLPSFEPGGVLKIDSTGRITTFFGASFPEFTLQPTFVAADRAGNIY